MSITTVVPEFILTATGEFSSYATELNAAHGAVAAPTHGVLPAGLDDVSARVTDVFAEKAKEVEALILKVEDDLKDFAGKIGASGAGYALTEALNSSPLQSIEHALSDLGHGAFGQVSSAFSGAGHVVGDIESKLSAAGNALIKPFAGLGALKGGLPHLLGSALNPAHFPLLSQILKNHFVYWNQLAGALKSFSPTQIWDTIKMISSEMGHNAYAVAKELTDVTASLTGNFLHMGAPFKLYFDALGAPIMGLVGFGESLGAIRTDLSHFHILRALGDAVYLPYHTAHDFLFRSMTIDMPLLKDFGIGDDLQFTLGGLLTGVHPINHLVDGNWVPLQGAQLGGLFGGLRAEAREIASLIAPPGSPWVTNPVTPHVAAVPPSSPGVVTPINLNMMGSIPLELPQITPSAA